MSIVVARWRMEHGRFVRNEVSYAIAPPPRDAIGAHLVHPHDQVTSYGAWRKAHRLPVEYAFRLLCIDGRYRTARAIARPVFHCGLAIGTEGVVIVDMLDVPRTSPLLTFAVETA